MTAPPTLSTIRAYWDSRATLHADSPAATTSDIHLRELEARTLTRIIKDLGLPSGGRVLDIGCGDGRTTMRIAAALPHLQFTGLDYSPAMIQNAASFVNQHAADGCNIDFVPGDVTALEDSPLFPAYDVIITVRCLINLPDADSQAQAINRIAGKLRSGGYYIAVENFLEGHDAMNAARCAVGLPPIEIRWHNRFFNEPQFLSMIAPYFHLSQFIDFASAYYYATRVIYSKLCQMQGEEPNYDHDIHRLAVDLPPYGSFSPVRAAVLQRV